MPLRIAIPASARASGSAGPSDHAPMLPFSIVALYVVAEGSVPSSPPMYSRFVPSCAAAPSVRAAGRAASAGDACHGRTAPAGTGQGIAEPFSGGQRLTGDQPRMPRSIVRETTK